MWRPARGLSKRIRRQKADSLTRKRFACACTRRQSQAVANGRRRDYAYRLGISDGEAMATRAVGDLIGRRRPVAFVV